jgi:hypothetical protein
VAFFSTCGEKNEETTGVALRGGFEVKSVNLFGFVKFWNF